ncbi:MAG: sigma-E factor regulatory protein RseB domain-containing protein [Planctomycetota bacterium]|nr:sigma-E factor regulatory protein RseB domain-containing protein [Planctomycetota bacterium]
MGALFGALGLGILSISCGSSAGLTDGTSGAVDLITQIQQAPYLVSHSGVRRVESNYNLDGQNDHLVYREEVFTDGQGGFAINPLGAITGATLPAGDFQLLQKAREGFHFRYRDFLVRDLAAFLQNYKLTSFGQVVQVAGRDCLELSIERKDASLSFDLAMDVETGLVLRYRELDASGHTYSKMEYESFDPAPDLTGVTLHQPSNQEQPLDPSTPALAQLGFQPFIPKLLPSSGFFFVEASSVVDALGTTWAKLSYTDGIETVFFLDAGPRLPESALGVGVKSSSSPPGTGGLSGGPDGTAPELQDGVRCFVDGPLTVVWGEVLEHRMILLGKATQSELSGMLQSALPTLQLGK